MIRLLFPKTDHQLCLVHLQRNVKKHLKNEEAAAFNEKLKTIKFSSLDHQSAVNEFKTLCKTYEKSFPTFIKNIEKKAHNYFSFFKYPKMTRKYIYTTNTVENLNKQIETIRVKSGGYFQSEDALNINIYLQHQRLVNGRWKKHNPFIAACQYELMQLFEIRFNQDLFAQTQHY